MKDFFGKMSRRTKLIIGGGIALVVILAIAMNAGGPADAASQYQTEEIGRGTLRATVGATGVVRARQSAILTWQTGGTVQAVNAAVGQQVSADEVLATLNKTSVPQNVISAEADLVTAQQALDDLVNSDTARAQALIALKDAQEVYDRAFEYRESLNGKIDLQRVTFVSIGGQQVPQIKYYKGFADAETIANAEDDLALKKAQLDDAQRAYDRVKDGPNPADVAAAEARVAAAQATLNMARIISPIAGTITQAEPIPGDQVVAGDVAFRVDDLSRLLVDVEVSEVDINSLSVGQEVALTFDAILDKPYHGQVIEVGQAGDTADGVVSFTVTVEITDTDELVKPGMTAGVNVVVNELNDVLLVPNRAVRVVDNQRVVYVLRAGQPVRVDVVLGQSDGARSVLVSGDVEEGDLVILNPPSENGGPFGG
jgi:HlyD family secretion protein